ncbi:MAG TPA: methylated-DNA--[protein]-cysteine S-methyltransferase [Planctomycetaceae bacterium]|nr:methylated-DNA--[protein]-cysteine S-methyltransferase [Planctomycetaceae bacterium]
MKQRLATRTQTKTAIALTTADVWTVWRSPIGWTGLLGGERGLRRVLMGYPSSSALESAMRGVTETIIPAKGRTSLCERIDAYFAGEPDSFADVLLADNWSTPFQRAVVQALRKVPYGQTTSYADLATRAGRPGAARAVGQVMATNPVPIVVPCHRVLASGGGLGGFSAPTGLVLKQWLLELESSSSTPRKPR